MSSRIKFAITQINNAFVTIFLYVEGFQLLEDLQIDRKIDNNISWKVTF